MEKVKNKILVGIFILLCLVGSFITIYKVYAASGPQTIKVPILDDDGNRTGEKTIEDDHDLANWATNSTKENNKSFVNSELNKFINKSIGLYYGDSKGHSTIRFPGAACMYHSQSGSEGGQYKIVNVIDFFGTSATVYSSPADYGTNVKGAEMNGALLYAMNKAASGNVDAADAKHSAWKSAFKRLFFEHRNLLSLIDPGFKSSDSNNDSTNATIDSNIEEAKREGKKFEDPTKKPKKATTTKKPTQNKSGYLGPFKIKTMTGYKPSKLTLEISSEDSLGSEFTISKVSTKDGDTYKQIDLEKIKEGEAFYIKHEEKITDDWTVKLNFKSIGYKGRLVLIREKTSGGQNLAIYGAPTSSKESASLKWSGSIPEEELGNLKIIKVDLDNPETKLEGAIFKVSNEDKSFVKADLKTDENGEINLSDLKPGRYTIEEITPPKGYYRASKMQQKGYSILEGRNWIVVNVYSSNDEENPVEVTFMNPKESGEGKLVIKKIEDGTEKVLSNGFEFKVTGPYNYEKYVYLKDGKGYIKGDGTTEDKQISSGSVIELSNLPYGEYTVVETKAPKEYAINHKGENVTITEKTKIMYVTIKNKPVDTKLGQIKIVKKDASTGEKLIGAKFKITAFPHEEYDYSGYGPSTAGPPPLKTVYDYDKEIEVTDKEGIVLSNLEAGTYTITEIQAPSGYEISDPKVQTAEVKEEKDSEELTKVTVYFYDYKRPPPPPGGDPDEEASEGEIIIYKYDEDVEKPIKGAKFKILQQCAELELIPPKYEHYGWKWEDDYSDYTTVTTGDDGYVRITVPTSWRKYNAKDELVSGNRYRYKIQEIDCEVPYDINDQIYIYASSDGIIESDPMELWKSEDDYEEEGELKSFPNKLYGNIELYKVDDDDYEGEKEDPLKDAKFIFYYIDEDGTKNYISSYTEVKNDKVDPDGTKGILAPSKVEFTTNEENAKEFVTDAKGYIKLNKLPAHRTYYAHETGLVEPDDENFFRLYSLKNEDVEFDLENLDRTATAKVKVANQQAYTRISGVVWDDTHEEGKETLRNNLYDSRETLIKGIEVRLVYDGTDTTVRQEAKDGEEGEEFITYTDENGYYEFNKVLKAELSKYNVKFKYNGLRYERVSPITNVKEVNGSKADDIDREGFNAKYAIIEKGVSKKEDKTDTNNLSYTRKDHTSTLVKNLGYTAEPEDYEGRVDPIADSGGTRIYADTSIIDLEEHLQKYDDAKYKEVRHINLGIYEKEQPDISVMKDLQNIRTEINGKEHTYNYEQRFKNMGLAGGDGHDVGVKFGNKYGKMKYTRAIYKSDYTNVSLGAKELEVYVTYKIQMKNTSTSLQTKVNRLVDFYDLDYEELPKVGTKIDGTTGKITEELKSERIKTEKGSDNQKLTISLDDLSKIPAQETQDIYVQFKLTRETVKRLEEEAEKIEKGEPGDNLTNNLVEIDSYSVFDEWGYVYAGIDKDSEPGTIVPGDESTYEDDTDSAPPISWVQPDKNPSMREFRGKVFLDKTTGELKSGQIREGDGMYDDSEPGIKGVKVKLVEKDTGIEYYIGEGRYKDGSGKTFDNYVENSDSSITEVNSLTDDKGEYLIRGYVPGNYVIKYTWGGQTVEVSYDGITSKTTETLEVKNYKGTIYDYTRNKVNDQYWYKGKGTGNNNVDLRYSDAIDDYETRKNIDQELKQVVHSERKYTTTEMTSTSLDMNIEVEYDKADEYTEGESYFYNIHNVDFGIAERARQRVEIKKRISHLRVILANGEVVSDVEVAEDGTMTGENRHVTFMKTIEDIGYDKLNPTRRPTRYELGFIKVELDNEILQGSKLELTYRFKFYNRSEVDINNEDYYKFGTTAPLYSGGYTILKENKDTGKKVDEGQVIKISPSVIVDYLDKNWGYEQSENNEYGWKSITQEEFKNLKDQVGRPIPLNEESIFGDSSDINNRVILYTEYLANSAVLPAKDRTVDLKVSKELTTSDDISLNNETEILELDKWDHSTDKEDDNPPGVKGAEIPTMPGDKVPGERPKGSDESEAPPVIVTPSTGNNFGYVMPIVLGIVSFAIVGVGVVFIKRKVLK